MLVYMIRMEGKSAETQEQIHKLHFPGQAVCSWSCNCACTHGAGARAPSLSLTKGRAERDATPCGEIEPKRYLI